MPLKKYSFWLRVLGRFFAAYVAVFGVLVVAQRSLLYFPNGSYLSPERAHVSPLLKEERVTTEDGLLLKGWYAPAQPGKKTLVFFHGNADSLGTIAFVSEPYLRAGYGFLLTEYRGFSGFSGAPSEKGLYADARAFVRVLFEKGVQKESIVFFGHSLGCAVATQMAFEFQGAGGLLLLAPFLSAPQMAQERYPVFPARFFVWDKFANDEKISSVRSPVLIGHGTSDRVVPFEHGKKLFSLAKEPKELRVIQGGRHSDVFDTPFFDASLTWLDGLAHP